MHWYVPTQSEDANQGGTFYRNACGADGSRHTESPKKVTCRACKALFAHPNTPALSAAKLYVTVVAEQEEGRKSDFSIEVKCNGCDSDLDVFGWYESVEVHTLIARTIHFLEHVAHDHAWGSEVLFRRDYTPFSVYELNYGMGKHPQTLHEEHWREDNGLMPPTSDIGRASFEARVVDPFSE